MKTGARLAGAVHLNALKALTGPHGPSQTPTHTTRRHHNHQPTNQQINHQTLKFRVEASWLAADARRGAGAASPAPELPGPPLGPACDCEDGGGAASRGPSATAAAMRPAAPAAAIAGNGGGGGCCGPRPLGEGAEGGCCSGARGGGGGGGASSAAADLRVPLAPSPASGRAPRASFDQLELDLNGAAAAGHNGGMGANGAAANGAALRGKHRHGAGAGAGAPRAGPAAAWVAAARRPGGALDATLLGRDAARALMTFVTTALSYLLMLAAMSFHVAMFFAVVTGIAVGTGVFGRFRSYVAVAHQDRCCG